jgi:hypothetical protein
VANDLSPDGKWALVQTGLWQAKEVHLAMLPTGAGESIVLPRGKISVYSDFPAFIDARRILIPANEEGHLDRLFIQEVPGGEPRPITPEGVTFGEAPEIISPDGQWVVAWDVTGLPTLYPVNGGKPKPIAGISEGEVPIRWTDKEDWIYIEDNCCSHSRKVFRLNVQTGARELWREFTLSDRVGIAEGPIITPTPDGKAYVYRYHRSLSTLYIVDGLK